jgi:pregnancy-associated plasma protein-A
MSRKFEIQEVAPKRQQAQRHCGTMASHYELVDAFPEIRENLASIERFTSQFELLDGAESFRVGVARIPVVVHVVFKTAAENIPDSQIHNQIAVLNRDFRATNPDINQVPAPFKPLAADARIEFVLATTDPEGNQTNGITRTQTNIDSFVMTNNPVKFSASGGVDAWNTQKYLNLWVCRLAPTATGQLLGYAQFPGNLAATDGVVIHHTAFGTGGTAEDPFDLGRTATHEVGHYLNLHHIWGDTVIPTCGDTDNVDDTPNQFGSNGGTPTFPRISCNNGPNGDMFMNYMDYVNDAAMFMFTQGQVTRMQATLAGPRNALITP